MKRNLILPLEFKCNSLFLALSWGGMPHCPPGKVAGLYFEEPLIYGIPLTLSAFKGIFHKSNGSSPSLT